MFQLFTRARTRNFFRDRASTRAFKARSADRDAETDRSRIDPIISAIETALVAAEAEQSGLGQRVQDVLARASVTFGNDTNEYLTREPLDNDHQRLFSAEILNGQRRLNELSVMVTHLKFLKAAALSRFSDFRPRGSADQFDRDQP
ncbi:hypothetical protein [Bradyrhizobium sp.]|uniref:hypothetical protein n=1 Tax=Bradyrhizobium sp. TaxID=376 RepID=UPI001C297A03|nr:hypothetical protein [Bradyrhizobium sp.]MBU6461116.1 hypothetical protein [Pseudomonadota bacterium]